ncbi:facilitated trehalose transporter Tret1-like isoform X5 [Plodia interpunctella]|uniref:facilitated trehalose transporter Tret1-like isoform X5 n=2 Tax=Plodia interpunctella TaxID=58824 RepID=UPI0023675BB7|nr:facilitated trehalose transporter Tret1-like isoform X5 [Plodia interpunctella]
MMTRMLMPNAAYDDEEKQKQIYDIIACTSPNLLLLDLGMAITFAIIAMPDLLNAAEGLSLNDEQASWFGSISFLAQPFGAVFSGPLVDFFGRKKANFLANIPHLISWTLLYNATNIPTLFVASALLGLGTGVMEAPINAYVGEITEPTTRGALCTLTQLFTSAGVLLMYFLGTVVHWRTAALICLSAPIASMLCVLLVPETPVWLLSRGREKEAMKSLRYLRGWTDTDAVREEFDKLVVYTKNLERCVICCNTPGLDALNCEHHNMNPIKRKILKFRYVMLCKETIRPLMLTIMYFSFHILSGYAALRPNLVNVCGALGMPGTRNNIMIIVGVITFVAALATVPIVKIAGKRKLSITAMLGCAISTTGLAIYARANLDPSVSSYDSSTFPTEISHVPEVLFFLLVIFNGLGIPWVLLGEVFPFRSRTTSQGIAAAANYVINFLAAKTFIDLESGLGLWGALVVYSMFGYLGFLYLYFFLPETEGKTLMEIESYYNGKMRTFADDPFIRLFRKSD